MKRRWDLRPNLVDCILEERIAPAIANLGIIIQTTNGLSLVTPFPGAVSLSSLSGGAAATVAQSVSGAAMPTSFYITGSRGISTFVPGNFTGNPTVPIGGAVGSVGGAGQSIKVGSGADDASAAGGAGTGAGSRTNQGYNGATPTALAYIGQPASGSGSSMASTGGQSSQQTQTAPVPASPPLGLVIPGSPSGSTPGIATRMSPQMGAPSLMPGLGTRLMPTLPGGLGVPTSVFPAGLGGN